MVKRLLTMWETWVQSLGWEDLLEKGIATHSSILAPHQKKKAAQRNIWGLLWWLRWLNICLQCGRPRFNPWVGKISWRRKWKSTPVFLPGKSHGQKSLVAYSQWGCKELDTTERLHLLKETKELYTENYKTLMKEIKDDINRWRDITVPG